MQVVWWIIFLISIPIYVFLVNFVFPKIFFKSEYEISFSYDRGLKNFKEKNGRSIVYEPKHEYKKYISQYILSERKGKKVIICRLIESISYLDYDIVLFDCNDEVFKVINIKENIENPVQTNAIELPSQTAYATLIINFIDNIHFNNDMVKRVSNRSLSLYAASICVLVILEVFLVKFCFANIFGDVFYQDFMTTTRSTLITFGIIFIAVLANMAFVVGYIHQKAKRNRRKSDTYEL